MTDFAAARRHMVDGQIRIADVTDLRILAAMEDVPREQFVPPQSADLAYLDYDLPLAGGRCLLKAMVFAKLLQAADIRGTDRVLDVGCVTGYGAAVLARLAGHVVAFEQDAKLIAFARERLGSIPNVTLASGPLVGGWPAAAPYDVIVVEGATGDVPHSLLKQLKDRGRLVCILGPDRDAKAMLYTRSGDDFGGRPLFDCAAPVLPGFAKKPVFTF